MFSSQLLFKVDEKVPLSAKYYHFTGEAHQAKEIVFLRKINIFRLTKGSKSFYRLGALKNFTRHNGIPLFRGCS